MRFFRTHMTAAGMFRQQAKQPRRGREKILATASILFVTTRDSREPGAACEFADEQTRHVAHKAYTYIINSKFFEFEMNISEEQLSELRSATKELSDAVRELNDELNAKNNFQLGEIKALFDKVDNTKRQYKDFITKISEQL